MKEGADNKPRSRYIPKAVVSELLEKARHRCCLCRVLIDPARFDDDALFGSLEKHHIHQFSEGGGHTYENLMLLCANCHQQVHKHPEKYPVDELREKKQHWVQMAEIVPSELEMPSETEDVVPLPFLVVSLNLRYSILASPQATVGDLALFVGENILKPLGEYDGHENWLEPERVGLARKLADDERLDPDLRLGEVELAPDDVLTARVPKIVVPVIIPPKLGLGTWQHHLVPELVPIPAGEFWMGTDRRRLERAGLEWREYMEEEIPYHRLYLPEYYIARYPVTNAQYAAFVRSTDYEEPSHWEEGFLDLLIRGNRIPLGKENHPVVNVYWRDAMAYCRWLSRETGEDILLPSEAEWEKAARGADGRIYPWGDELPTADLCNFDDNVGDTTPAGRYSPVGDSPYGCADMAGNVWEWTRSLREEYPYDPEDGREDLEVSGRRVLRGGSFYFTRYVRCASRFSRSPNFRDWSYGFRVVASPFSRTQ